MQAAYDVNHPNGTGRRAQGDRVIYTFRLYKKLDATPLGDPDDAGDGIPGEIRGAVRTARSFLQNEVLGRLQSSGGERLALIREIKVPLIIEHQDMIPEVRSRFSYLRGGAPGENFFIDLPFRNAKGITRVRISGRTFWTPILIDGVPVDGASCLVDLQRLIDDYLNPPDGLATADLRLYWVDTTAPVSAEEPFGESEWWIHPERHGVRTRQSAQRPFNWHFSIEFLALRSNRDLAKAEDGLLGSLFGLATLKNLLDELGLGEVADVAEEIFGVATEVKGLLDDLNAVAVAVTDVITGAREFIVLSIAKVRGILVDVQELIGQLEDAYELAIDIPSLTEEQLQLLRQNVPGLVEDPDSAVVLTDALARSRDFLQAVLADPSKFAPRIATSAGQTIALQIQPGTTLERLAAGVNVSAETLIEANSLRYPFVDSRVRSETIAAVSAAARAAAGAPGPDPVATLKAVAEDTDRALAWVRTHGVTIDAPTAAVYVDAAAAARGAYDRAKSGGSAVMTPAELAALDAAAAAGAALAVSVPSLAGVLYAGDVVRVPQERPDQIPSVVGIDGSQLNLVAAVSGVEMTEEDRLFGIDLLLNDDGDLEWDADRLDLRLDRGLAHMTHVQARYLRLPLGALGFAPEIGNYAYADLGKAQTQADNNQLAYAIWRTLRQDPRIRQVRRVRAVSEAGAALLEYDAQLINGQQLEQLRSPLGVAA